MRVGIALGSNLGDRAAHLRGAVEALRALLDPPMLISRVYETVPVDCPPRSGNFLNAAVEGGWTGDLKALLHRLQAIEKRSGRPSVRDRHSPRVLDLDLLYADRLELDDEDLTVPHPRIFQRSFVLLPLRDIAPRYRSPRGKLTVSDAPIPLPEEIKIADIVLV